MVNRALLAAFCVVVGGCGSAPADLAFDGKPLRLARTWTLEGGARTAVYSDDGVEGHLRDAKDRVQVTWSETGSPAELMSTLLVNDGRRIEGSVETWLVQQDTPEASCAVKRVLANGRFSVLTRECEKLHKRAVCAEADVEVPIPCNTGDDKCKALKSAELCKGRVDEKTPALHSAASAVAK